MPYIQVPRAARLQIMAAAEERWKVIDEVHPELASAVALQRRLIGLVVDLMQVIEGVRFPRLSLPPRYLAAKLARGVPALAGEPIPLPVPLLTGTLVRLCGALAQGGAGDVADRIRAAIDSRTVDAASLLAASLSRDQAAIRAGATSHGLAPDLVWLVGELAVGPFVHALRRLLFAENVAAPGSEPARPAVPPGARDWLSAALEVWARGYCPACGSWPALAEVVSGHRILRCSFCAAAWELPAYACVYCGETGEPFVTAAPNEERKDRRVELCAGCGAYLKAIDIGALSPFPLLSIGDLETMDLDMAAMEHGYTRPALREFRKG